MNTVSNRIIKNTIYLYIKTGVSLFVWIFTTRVILNNLGTSDFGIYNIVGGAIGMLGFLNVTMATTVQRYLNYDESKHDIEILKSIFNVGIVFHVIIAVFLIVLFLGVGYYMFHGVLNIPSDRLFAAKVVYVSFMISTLFTVVSVPFDAVINSHENMLYYSIIGIIETMLKLVVAIVIQFSSYDKLIVYGVLMSAISLNSLTLMYIYCHRKYEECIVAPQKYYSKCVARRMLSFAGWNFVGTTSSVVGNNGINIVLNHFFGVIINTSAGIASQIQGQLFVLSNNMLKALAPVLAKEEGAGNTTSVLTYSYKGCKYSYFLFAIFAVPFFIETPYLLCIWLGGVPEWAVLFVRLQLIRGTIESITMPMRKVLEAKGKIGHYNMVVFIFNILPVFFLFIFYNCGLNPYWHYIVAIFLMVIVVDTWKIYCCKKYCGLKFLDFFSIVIRPCLIISFVAFFLGYIPLVFLVSSFIRVCLIVVITSTVMLVGIYISFTESEKMIFCSLVQKTRSKFKK